LSLLYLLLVQLECSSRNNIVVLFLVGVTVFVVVVVSAVIVTASGSDSVSVDGVIGASF